ncbi:Ppx/GppA phosphatase family protein [Lancefieldella rimae]|uniref:Ppx/GppA phosphatase family protein n=1 Tax=Lancefieldella rimae TaxID=1383 RepID=UPI002889F946|nr:phosphatase [Lancefieldella rimae]
MIAVIDIGTVTVRLAVAEVAGGRVLRMAKYSEICNLGVGVDATGLLDADAIKRVYMTVASYVEAAKEAGTQAIVCTLTSAARDAKNAPDLGMALASLGLEPMIIPGEIEAALTFLGVAQDFSGRQILVADSGGGSTELALGNVTNNIINLPFIRSLDVGCRRVTDRFLSEGDIPTPAHLEAAHVFASRLMRDALAASEYQEAIRPEVLVATGGTATSLIAMNAQLEPYDPAFVHLRGISVEDVQKLEELLAKLSVEERAKLPGLQEKRAPVILGGTIVLFELMQATGFTTMIASESDLLFGLLITSAAVQEGRPSPVVWKPILKPLDGGV